MLLAGLAAMIAVMQQITPSQPNKARLLGDEIVRARHLSEIETACVRKAEPRARQVCDYPEAPFACISDYLEKEARTCACAKTRLEASLTTQELSWVAPLETAEATILNIAAMRLGTKADAFKEIEGAAHREHGDTMKLIPQQDRQRLYMATAEAGRICRLSN